MSSDDPTLIYPAKQFKDAEEFFQNFDKVQIPFMEDFYIQAVPDYADPEEKTKNVCFKSAVLGVAASVSTLLAVSSAILF